MPRWISPLIFLLVALLLLLFWMSDLSRPHSSVDSPALSSVDLVNPDSPPSIDVIYRDLNSPADIMEQDSLLVKPIVYTGMIDFNLLEKPHRKQSFIDLLLPGILISRQRVLQLRSSVEQLMEREVLLPSEQEWLEQLMVRYKAGSIAELHERVNVHPTSIVLAQAALECGWGTSRFFREGMNIFGIWSYNRSEPRLMAQESRPGKPLYVRKYSTLYEAIDDYFLILARGPYKAFRQARVANDDPMELIAHLQNYSELRGEYVQRLSATLLSNRFTRYDDYRIDPHYIRE